MPKRKRASAEEKEGVIHMIDPEYVLQLPDRLHSEALVYNPAAHKDPVQEASIDSEHNWDYQPPPASDGGPEQLDVTKGDTWSDWGNDIAWGLVSWFIPNSSELKADTKKYGYALGTAYFFAHLAIQVTFIGVMTKTIYGLYQSGVNMKNAYLFEAVKTLKKTMFSQMYGPGGVFEQAMMKTIENVHAGSAAGLDPNTTKVFQDIFRNTRERYYEHLMQAIENEENIFSKYGASEEAALKAKFGDNVHVTSDGTYQLIGDDLHHISDHMRQEFLNELNKTRQDFVRYWETTKVVDTKKFFQIFAEETDAYITKQAYEHIGYKALPKLLEGHPELKAKYAHLTEAGVHEAFQKLVVELDGDHNLAQTVALSKSLQDMKNIAQDVGVGGERFESEFLGPLMAEKAKFNQFFTSTEIQNLTKILAEPGDAQFAVTKMMTSKFVVLATHLRENVTEWSSHLGEYVYDSLFAFLDASAKDLASEAAHSGSSSHVYDKYSGGTGPTKNAMKQAMELQDTKFQQAMEQASEKFGTFLHESYITEDSILFEEEGEHPPSRPPNRSLFNTTSLQNLQEEFAMMDDEEGAFSNASGDRVFSSAVRPASASSYREEESTRPKLTPHPEVQNYREKHREEIARGPKNAKDIKTLAAEREADFTLHDYQLWYSEYVEGSDYRAQQVQAWIADSVENPYPSDAFRGTKWEKNGLGLKFLRATENLHSEMEAAGLPDVIFQQNVKFTSHDEYNDTKEFWSKQVKNHFKFLYEGTSYNEEGAPIEELGETGFHDTAFHLAAGNVTQKILGSTIGEEAGADAIIANLPQFMGEVFVETGVGSESLGAMFGYLASKVLFSGPIQAIMTTVMDGIGAIIGIEEIGQYALYQFIASVSGGMDLAIFIIAIAAFIATAAYGVIEFIENWGSIKRWFKNLFTHEKEHIAATQPSAEDDRLSPESEEKLMKQMIDFLNFYDHFGGIEALVWQYHFGGGPSHQVLGGKGPPREPGDYSVHTHTHNLSWVNPVLNTHPPTGGGGGGSIGGAGGGFPHGPF